MNSKVVRAIGITVLVAGALFAGCQMLPGSEATPNGTEESAALTAVVARGHVEETISATGSVAGNEHASLGFASNGRIEEVLVAEGQSVDKGDVLARLDSRSLAQQVARAEASLVTAEARLAQAEQISSEADLASAEAALSSAEAGLDRLLAGPAERDLETARLNAESARNQLWSAQTQRDSTKGNPMSSQSQIDAAEAQVLVADLSVQQATLAQERLMDPPTEADLAMARSQVAQAEAQLAQLRDRPKAEDVAVAQAQFDEAVLGLTLAQETLQDAALTAPFAGTVLTVLVSAGEWASPGMPAAVVADTEHLILDATVDEIDMAELSVGQAARLSFEALPKQEIAGTVALVAPSSTNTGGAVGYHVEIHFVPGDLPVRIGMTTNVDIVTREASDALMVPNRAIDADRSARRYYVTRLDASGGEERVEVQVGLRGDDHTQILSGLSEGDVLTLPEISGASDFVMPGPMGGEYFGGSR